MPLACSPPPALGTWPATEACALTGNQTGDPLDHRPVLNPLSHISQGRSSFLIKKFIKAIECGAVQTDVAIQGKAGLKLLK